MIKYLLDTNVVSELRKLKPHVAVITWIDEVRNDQLYISAVTFAELQRGIERPRRLEAQKAREIDNWLDQLELSRNVLPMDSVCFREWARLLEAKSEYLSEDAMIAATARVHALVVATRNEKHFIGLHVELINPFKTRPS